MAIDERDLFDAVELDMSSAFRRRLERDLLASASVDVGPETSDKFVDRFVPVSTIPDRPRPRSTAFAMIGVAAALVLVGLVMLVRRDESDHEPIRPGIDTVAPQPSASPSPSTSTPTSTTSTTTPDTTVAAPRVVRTYADPTTQQLATIQSAAAALLTRVDTLRATATWNFSTQRSDGQVVDSQVMVNNVTLASNGSMWSLTPNGWSSYDSSTGTALTESIGDDGLPIYTRFDNFSSLPLPVVLGVDPTPHLDGLGTDVEVSESEQDGRPVWEITSVRDATGPDGATTHTEETLEIDKATGLVIGRASTSTVAGTVSVQSATLTNLELNVAFPPASYPGSFPADAKVQGSPGPSSFHLLTVDEAATLFGDGLVAPSLLPATARVFVDGVPNQPVVVIQPAGTPLDQNIPQAITFDFPQGFAPSSITVFKDVDTATPTSSARAGGASVVSAGPFKGAPSELRLGVLTIDDGTVTIIIRASSDARALEVANSLVKVG